MSSYKRSQVEDAVITVLEARGGRAAQLKRRITGLLQTDRIAERQRYAFFRSGSPGTGSEVQFSSYEAFAILMGLILVDFGFPFRTAVSMLRSAKPDLLDQHRRVLHKPPPSFFEDKIRRAPRLTKPGATTAWNRDPLFFVIASLPEGRSSVTICQGMRELEKRMREPSIPIGATFFYELGGTMKRFEDVLRESEPRQRGRPRKS